MLSHRTITLFSTLLCLCVPYSNALPKKSNPGGNPPNAYAANGLAGLITELVDGNNKEYGGWAWDWEVNPQMCGVYFSTYAGGGCKMAVYCQGGAKEYNEYNVCEVGKRQYWHDDRIGDFSIEYAKGGGVNSERDGLHNPILQVKNLQNWAPIIVEDVAAKQSTLSADDSYACFYDYHNENLGDDGKLLEWGCGIPRLGQGFHSDGTNLENNIPNAPGEDYAVGTCALHLVQHQKDDPAKDDYGMEIWIKDANRDDIGSIYPAVSMPADVAKDVNSKLGQAVVVMMHKVDEDPVSFVFGKQEWDTNGDRCKVGAYDGGKREMDCDFPCGK